jgi:DNA-binding transcriptional ArsR family regulator
MPVQLDDYESQPGEVDWVPTEGSNAHTILSFLLEHPETGFTPSEIAEATGIPKGSVGPTLQRLEDRRLVRHKGSYWAIARDDRLASLTSTLSTLKSMDNLDDWEDVNWEEEAADEDEMEAWRGARRE